MLRHCTDMEIQRHYVDSHGQSEVAFAFCYLLNIELAPRLKAVARQKLYLPDIGLRDLLGDLAPVLTRAIDWELIERQYDEIIKYAAALRRGTADPEAILRRFVSTAVKHPTYAFAEYEREMVKERTQALVQGWPDRKAFDDSLMAASTRDFRAKLAPLEGALYDERLYHALR